MFSRRPRSRTELAAIAVVLLVSFSGGPFVLPHADPFGDPAHNPQIPIAHDESAHRLGGDSAPLSPDRPQHCLLCHLVRLSCALVQIGERIQEDPAAHGRWQDRFLLLTSQSDWSLAPTRAPPV